MTTGLDETTGSGIIYSGLVGVFKNDGGCRTNLVGRDKLVLGKISDLTLDRPTRSKFEMVINLKIGKALGFTVPTQLLQLAGDELNLVCVAVHYRRD